MSTQHLSTQHLSTVVARVLSVHISLCRVLLQSDGHRFNYGNACLLFLPCFVLLRRHQHSAC